MLDISVIILTFNEELHIQRCIERINNVVKYIYVVDCYSTDKTVEIIKKYKNIIIVQHKWPGNQAAQFNWALDNLNIQSKWILRLDADEYLSRELINELEQKLPYVNDKVSAILLPLGRCFRGKILKHGIVRNVKMIRIFRYGKAYYENRLMDEHLNVIDGDIIAFENKFIDDNLISIKDFIDKHNTYSSREAALLLDAEYNLIEKNIEQKGTFANEVLEKRKEKIRYAKLPLYWRAIGYFIYRYFIKLGFLDGRAGFEWDFFQGLWYRILIDSKIAEAKRKCNIIKGSKYSIDKNMLINYIETVWNINIRKI